MAARRKSDVVVEEVTALESSFCARQLASSGLTADDVMAHVTIDKMETILCPFKPGSIDVTNNFRVAPGDDMLIYYYDLYGNPVQYTPKGSPKPRQYVRIRWANPGIHTTGDGKEIKYQTPPTAPSRCYIPERIRALYRDKKHIDTLYIQEGEKKAEKACLHNIPSIGIQGISNFGNARDGLLTDIQEIARVCTVNNIVLMFDADWDNLHTNLIVGDSADKRPNMFAKTVVKFKSHIGTLHNLGLSVNCWWGHVNDNVAKDKGIDDLLSNTLKGKESALSADIEFAMHSHNGSGEYVCLHNISTLSDSKIMEFWSLNDPQKFYERHKNRLDAVPTFKIGRIRYKVEEGKIVPLSKYSSDIDIFSIENEGEEKEKVVFNCCETMNFLRDNGFCRILSRDKSGSYLFIRNDDGIISEISTWVIRNFVLEYISANCKIRKVNEFFCSKIATLLADKQLEQLVLIEDNFNHFERGVQLTPYNNGMVEITADSITPGKPFGTVWKDHILSRNFKRVPVIAKMEKVGDAFQFEYTPEGEKCEFLQYLINISNTIFTYGEDRPTTEEETKDWCQHLANKITTIGYLLCDYKYPSERKTVIIQDHAMSEVGRSKGGSGKSLLGTAISKIRTQAVIDGKLIDPNFPLNNVTRETRNVFIDDVRVNFDFESIFNMANGQMHINKKNKDPLDLRVEESPKIFIATNHAINGAEQDSVARRILYMEASAWYHQGFTLFDEFQHMFFDDWDEAQWNLFDNLMAECVMYYFRSFDLRWGKHGGGAIAPPMQSIHLRTLRQNMSETLLQWAEGYFDPSGDHLNERLGRNDIWDDFYSFAGGTGHGVTRTNIKTRLEYFCKYMGYDMNINRPNDANMYYKEFKAKYPNDFFCGTSDKSNGKEYITIWSPQKEEKSKPF